MSAKQTEYIWRNFSCTTFTKEKSSLNENVVVVVVVAAVVVVDVVVAAVVVVVVNLFSFVDVPSPKCN